MADFRTILDELALGSTDPEQVCQWVDEAIQQGTDPAALAEDLDAVAERLPDETVTTIRKHLAGKQSPADGDDGLEFDFDIAVPDAEAGNEAGEKNQADNSAAGSPTPDFDGELTLEAPDSDATVADPSAAAPGTEEVGTPDDVHASDEPVDEATPEDEDDPDKTVFDPSIGKPADETRSPDPADNSDKTEIVPPDTTDRTELLTPDDADDRTELMSPDDTGASPVDPDATVLGDNDPTERGRNKTGNSPDPFAMGGGGNATRPGNLSTPTGTGWPTSTAWPGQGGGHDPDNIGPGTILKDRFELLSAIGEGGMGTVYKARDLLKVEAKDRNPYIAVKLLSGDFREHPEAFIALQRESSKAQKLAHPNIATVYDFDRDGSTVYMTMELLEGEELAKYIKKLPPGGLPAEEALNIIKQLCDGLEYAHARGLVHSDFKPGNCYYLTDGTVKILDFGIARASKTRSDTSGETTVFDPGQLGALTPAYATPEMFDGMETDARDDIYALACVAWELLQGKHPFNKLSSVKALEKGLSPQPFTKPGFNKRQARALIKALDFRRDHRTASITEFWDGIRYKKNKAPLYAGIGFVAFILIGGLSYKPIIESIEDSKNAETIAQLERNQVQVPDVLASLDQYSERARRNLLENGREHIIGYFEQQAEAEVDATAGKYDYPAALRIINEAKALYPDSAQLQSIETTLSEARAAMIAALTASFDQYLEQDRLLPIEGEEDITDILNRMRQADPGNAVLSDARLTQRYADLAETAIAADDWQRARKILNVSLEFSPADPSLLNLSDQVDRELQRQAEEQRVAQLKTTLREAQGSLDALDDYAAITDELNELEALRPDDSLLLQLQSRIRETVGNAIDNFITNNNWTAAEESLTTFAGMFTVDALADFRARLSRAEIQAGYQPENLGSTLSALESRRSSIQELLDSPRFDSEWHTTLLSRYKETIALLRPGNTWFDSLQEAIITAYMNETGRLIDADRFDAARRILQMAEAFGPQPASIEQQQDRLAAAEAIFEQEQQERIRLARIAAQKNTLKVQTEANDVASATRTFENLKQELPADDPYLAEEAPQLIATAYQRLATTQGERGNYSNAVQFARRGLEFLPGQPELQDALARYSNLAQREELMQFAASATTGNVRELPARVRNVRELFPEDATAISNEAIQALADRIKSLESSDIFAANDLWDAARNLYPDNNTLKSLDLKTPPKPSKYVPDGRKLLQQNKLSAALDILETARREEPGNQQVEQFANDLEERQEKANQYFVSFQQLLRQGQKSQAKLYLDEALRLWSDNEAYQKEMASNYTTTRAPTRSADGSRPCSANLAGYGRSGRAVCFDMLGGDQRGPELVVVPAGGSFDTPFAIGKYEVSTGDFNAFCRATGQCQPREGNSDLPATGMPFTQMQAYVAWLTEMTGKEYRLPTAMQWEYAANADNPGAVRDFNCRVSQGSQIIKGLTLLEIKSGRPNPWGLTNHVGNVQEVVRSGTSMSVRGGSFQDNLSTCDITLSRNYSGEANEVTGFRVVRDID